MEAMTMQRWYLGILLLIGITALAADLPVTDVVIYSSGVGFVQRTGTVKDDATVQLTFKAEQINDLLKSLVLLDLDGGKVGAVTYGAKDPIGKTLQAFAINLEDNPSLANLLNRLRGVSAEVIANTMVTGKILGVETKKKIVKDEIIEVEVLNLLTDAGIKSIRLEEISSIRLLDDRLNKELQDALAVLATGLDNQRKPVNIAFTGKGARRVAVGYVTEMPIWKTSYRLVLGQKEALLQGWAIVENTSDADWTNVRLSLVSGRPVSFIEDLYTPLYIDRPVYEPERFASLRPMTYGAELEVADKEEGNGAAVDLNERTATAPAISNQRQRVQLPGIQLEPNVDGLVTQNTLRTYSNSIETAAAAKDLGQGFIYALKDPVTLPRQASALLPIVSGGVGAWKVSISSPSSKYPMYGLRLKNTTGVHLMGGPITVYDDDVYAGDAVIEDLQPGEDRLISYAVDLGLKVERRDDPRAEEIVAFKLVKGNLTITRKFQRTVHYTAAVQDGKDRKLLIEHAFQKGWNLVAPAKADERTDTVYRFMLPVPAKDGAKLDVVEGYQDLQATLVSTIDSNTLVVYMQNGKMSPEVRAALQRVRELQAAIQDTRNQRAQAEAQIRTITEEQNRIRANMNSLDRTSDLYKRYVTKLGEQETQVEKLRATIDQLNQTEQTQRKALDDYVAGLNIE
jgi:hypothetical protein